MTHSPTPFLTHRAANLLYALTLILVSACSGGGGSNGTVANPLDSLPYTGSTSAAVINSADIEELLLLAYFGPAPLRNLNNDTQVDQQASVASALSLIPLTFTVNGPCGGIAYYDLTLNDSTGAVSGTVRYEDYNDCQGSTTGTVQISGLVDLQSGDFQQINMSFELLAINDNILGQLVTSGTIGVVMQAASEHYSIDLRIRDELSGKVYWMDGYRSTLTLLSDGSATYLSETISAGRFYDPDRGYIDISTITPVHTYTSESRPSSGSLLAVGADNASAHLNFISPVLYSVEADTDADDLFEYDSGRIHYPGANTLPLADAGADTLGNVGCAITFDGGNSSDADLDTLQYNWAIELAPASSVSQLTAADTATPGFTPDQKGEYRFALTLFDGYDSVVDTVNLTAYGDLFCLADMSITPFAQIGQYEADVAVGDVTSDGRADVLALTQASELYQFNQNSSGGLNTPIAHTVVNWRDVAVGDINGDGRNDAVVTTDTGVGVLLQNGAGGLDALVETPFTPALSSPPASTYSLALGDFNNDTRLDVAVLPEGGPLYLFLQNLDGSLGPSSTHETLTTDWNKVMAGDVTGDGLTDIIISRADMVSTDNIGVLPQAAAGGFDATVYYTIGTFPVTYTSSLAVGDLNADGRLDLAYELYEGIDINSTYVGLMPQSTGGTFTSPVIYNAYYPPIHDMAIADVTGDGLDDLVVLHGTPDSSVPFTPTTVAVMAATSGGSLSPYDIYPIEQTPQSWGRLAIGDLNGDSKNDIAVTAQGCDAVLNCGPNLVVLHGVK